MTLTYRSLGAAFICLGLLTACMTPPKPVARIPFPTAEYSALAKTGTGVVEGQLFMRTVGGDVKFGAGSEISINPITSYSEQWFDAAHRQLVPLDPGDPRQDQYIMITQADGSGNFKFTGVPPGKYFVSGVVQWQVPTQYGLSNQGGRLTNRVTVSDGQITRTILTQ